MKLLLKLAIAAFLANAAFRIGTEYLNHVKFREDVREAVIYKSRSDDELRRSIAEAAARYDVPIDADDVSIRHEQKRILVDGQYKKTIEIIPTFPYVWPFTFNIDASQSTTARLIPPPPEKRPIP